VANFMENSFHHCISVLEYLVVREAHYAYAVCTLPKGEGFQKFGRVIAPSEAEETSAAYLAKTPVL
jgi:hypothetical protein